MKARYELNQEQVAEMDLEITISMSVREWGKLKRELYQLRAGGPLDPEINGLDLLIGGIIERAEKQTAMRFEAGPYFLNEAASAAADD